MSPLLKKIPQVSIHSWYSWFICNWLYTKRLWQIQKVHSSGKYKSALLQIKWFLISQKVYFVLLSKYVFYLCPVLPFWKHWKYRYIQTNTYITFGKWKLDRFDIFHWWCILLRNPMKIFYQRHIYIYIYIHKLIWQHSSLRRDNSFECWILQRFNHWLKWYFRNQISSE